MTNPFDLRRLSDAAEAAPPFGFEEFQRRCAVAQRRQRATVWSIAASVAVLGLVAVLALMTQPQHPAAELLVALPAAPPAAVAPAVVAPQAAPREPALVNLHQFEVTSELEDHIALLDAQISAAHVYAAPPERLRQMESTRAQLNESLQRVSYAQALLNL
jgi:hypothetical protein